MNKKTIAISVIVLAAVAAIFLLSYFLASDYFDVNENNSTETDENSGEQSPPDETVITDTADPENTTHDTSDASDTSAPDTAAADDSTDDAVTTDGVITDDAVTTDANYAAESTGTWSGALTRDFTVLKEINPDIYAWVNIPDTVIDYPVVQSASDNTRYLRRDIYGNYDINGSIFSENYNSTDFSDYMTVIYGHTMLSGAMFFHLLDYMDNVYFNDHRTLIIYTEDAVRTYTIFAAYEWDTRHLLLNIDFSNAHMRSVYLDYVLSMRPANGNIDSDMTVTSDDRIVTLSCCTYDGTGRFLVQAVLTEEEYVN